MNRFLPRFDAYISTEGTDGLKNSISHSEGEDDLAISTQPVDLEKNSNIGQECQVSTPVVSPLTYAQIPTAAETIWDAFEWDVFSWYMDGRNGTEPAPKRAAFQKWISYLGLWYYITRRIALQIAAAHSVTVIYPPPKASRKRTLIEWLIDTLAEMIGFIVFLLQPKIAQKRAKDFSDQKNKIAGEHFGEKVDEMFYVHVIATSPSYQGRGHGGALMDSIARIADRVGKDGWLISSGPHNVPFYKFHGYESVGQIRMGKNDLLWFKGEIVCDVMVRKSRKVFQNQFSDSGVDKI